MDGMKNKFMIQVSDLRIGNKVKCAISNDAGIYTVLGIPAWGFDGCGDGTDPLVLIDRCPKELVPERKIHPIPLTPEILLACGFGYDRSNEYWTFYSLPNNWHIGESCHNEPSAGVEKGKFYWGENYKEIKSLHQLQNLYFALTGSELEYKPI